ncbi:hypothetical protein [Streptomyces sp. cg35]|uniref:hypothetical protein n=1 Tax=Streptomyces sp. cg35 TaxID=3421650 RepID=UPI003D17794C
MTIRRPLAAACLVLTTGLSLVGCGDEKAADTARAVAPSTQPPSTPAPSATAADCATPTASGPPAEQPSAAGDANPKYRENHAFQSTLELKGASLCTALREEERVKGALARLAGKGGVTSTQVTSALTKLGYAPDKVSTTGSGGLVAYVVDLSPVCVEGSVGDVVNVETHGVYIEGTGCVKPQGGH